MADTDQKINRSNVPNGTKCAERDCGHTIAAHGTSGFICCRCGCKRFVVPEEAHNK